MSEGKLSAKLHCTSQVRDACNATDGVAETRAVAGFRENRNVEDTGVGGEATGAGVEGTGTGMGMGVEGTGAGGEGTGAGGEGTGIAVEGTGAGGEGTGAGVEGKGAGGEVTSTGGEGTYEVTGEDGDTDGEAAAAATQANCISAQSMLGGWKIFLRKSECGGQRFQPKTFGANFYIPIYSVTQHIPMHIKTRP